MSGPGAPTPALLSLLDLSEFAPAGLPPVLHVPPVSRPFDAVVRPPGSKSITNRLLLLAALATGESTLCGALADADDARVMTAALETLGAHIAVSGETVRVHGVGGTWPLAPGTTAHLNLHNAGTATRFLAAAALLAPPGSALEIDGNDRMRQRPIGELGALLSRLGCRVAYAGQPGCPPLRVEPPPHPAPQPASQTLDIGPTQSSQFVSALMLVAPFLPGGAGLHLRFTHPPTSAAYIRMTAAVLRSVGVRVDEALPAGVLVGPLAGGPGGLPAFMLDVEPDASGATYPLAAAALVAGARVRVPGLTGASLQGDANFARVLVAAGAAVEETDSGISVRGGPRIAPLDCTLADMPDAAMTAAVVACFASPTAANPSATTTLRGLRTLRVKETDRLEALREELSKLGARVEIVPESGPAGPDEALRITPPSWHEREPVVFDTYGDHRMAMALALVGLRRPGVAIRDPACVAKTYPGFWRDLRHMLAGRR